MNKVLQDMEKGFQSVEHFFASIPQELQSLMKVMHLIFSKDQIASALQLADQAAINYTNSAFQYADSHSFISNSLIKVGVSEQNAGLLSAIVLKFAEKEANAALSKLNDLLAKANG